MLFQFIRIWVSVYLSNAFASKISKPESGQGLVEYALLMVLVGAVVMALLMTLGPALANMFQTIADSFQ